MVNRLVFVDNTVSGAPIAICHCRVKAVIEKHNCVSIKVFCLFFFTQLVVGYSCIIPALLHVLLLVIILVHDM